MSYFCFTDKIRLRFFAKNEMCKSCANMNDFIFPLQKYQYKSSAEIGKLHISICANQRSYTFCYLQKKVCFSNKTCHICNIICCDFFCLHIMYNEIQFHAEEAQNSIMIVLFMPNLADLKSIKRNVLLEKVHTCK